MKRAALATMMAIMLSCAAGAHQRPQGHDAAIAGTAGPTVTIAMGPISAPQRRNPNAAAGSGSESPQDTGSSPAKKSKHRHRHPSRN